MKEKILIAEDDAVTRLMLESTLADFGYDVISTANGLDALRELEGSRVDVILSDYYMPGMNGAELLQGVLAREFEGVFIFLTGNSDLRIAIQLLKNGADDYLVKPFLSEELHFRIQKNLRQRTQENVMRKVEQEKTLLALEHRKLVNWRALYANKDIRQTEQMMQLLSRSINQSGGFMWLDLLKDQRNSTTQNQVSIDTEILDLIIASAEAQKKIFDYLTFLGNLPHLELTAKPYEFSIGLGLITSRVNGFVAEFQQNSDKIFSVQTPTFSDRGTLSFDVDLLGKCLREVIINAIKYSPAGANIQVGFLVDKTTQGTFLEVFITNPPIVLQKLDNDGEPIRGIPYEYSELVFDPFYTLEGYPTYFEGEDWVDGTGLYLCRQILKKHKGWVSASNGIDYTGDSPTDFVRITLALPISEI
jgi:DNA-binding response OmpR family regulator